MRVNLIKNNIVENIAEVADMSTATALWGNEYTIKECVAEQPGDVHNPGNNTYVRPAAQRIIHLTKYQFMSRLSNPELVAIYECAKTDSVANIFIKKLELSEEVQLDNPELLQGLLYLVSQGILSAGRVTEILA